MAKSYEEIKHVISTITNEVEDGANTANRIGGAMDDIADFVKELTDIQSEKIEVLHAEISEEIDGVVTDVYNNLAMQEQRINQTTNEKIANVIVQESGDGENVVISQKAVTEKFTELGSKVRECSIGESIESYNVSAVYTPIVQIEGLFFLVVDSDSIVNNLYVQVCTESSKSSVTQEILVNGTLVSGRTVFPLALNKEKFLRFSISDEANYPTGVSFSISSTLIEYVDSINKNVDETRKKVESINGVLETEIVRTNQQFDKNNVKEQNLYFANDVFNFNKYGHMFAIETENLKGKYVGTYIDGNIAQYVTDTRFNVLLSNDMPTVGTSIVQTISTARNEEYARGRGLIEADAKYICISLFVNSTDAELVEKTIYFVKDRLMVVVQDSTPEYPISYEPYKQLNIASEKEFVKKEQGILNSGRYLIVGADGIVTLGEKQKEETFATIEDAVVKENKKTYYLANNILSDNSVVLTEGWSGNITNGLVHTSGSEAVTLNVATEAGKRYIFTCTASKNAEGAVLVTIGDFPWTDVYNGTNQYRLGFIGNGGVLKIKTSAESYNIELTNIQLREVVEEGEHTDSITFDSVNVESGVMYANVDGWWNVAIGPNNTGNQTLGRNVNGSRNVAIGGKALSCLQSGTRNIAIGTYAMAKIDEGDRNISIGADTLYDTDSLVHRTAYDNVAIGKACMKSGAVVKNNVAVGSGASGSNADGASGNVCVGYQSGNYANKNNTNVGARSGYYQRGSNNVAIGYGSGASTEATNTSNTIAIGYNANVTKSNQMVLGNPNITEVIIAGKKIIFNEDGTCTWESI